MKIHVSQGHEKGIGLEVFFKTVLLLTDEELSTLKLHAFKKSVEENLTLLQLPYKLTEKSVLICDREITVQWCKSAEHSQSHTSLLSAMTSSEKEGVLFTLPTSKDQLKNAAGHTEFFRSHYKNSTLGMFFSSPDLQVLLLTDHVAIHKLSEVLSEEMIYAKVKHNLAVLREWKWQIEKVLISGLNPHAGENGMIGHEDERVRVAIKRLLHKDQISMSGPYPGDTMLLEKRSSRDLLIYLFHDQGLGVFKGVQGFIGANITLGLPYPRVSPDHGTSFSLFGKNQADYRGCSFAVREAITLLTRIRHGKNSSH